ncbi:hypothetical protein HDE_11234 [Halotydeus destructor]|nr:hypothetical protein HDE_11234 [Halotydeus destructor]
MTVKLFLALLVVVSCCCHSGHAVGCDDDLKVFCDDFEKESGHRSKKCRMCDRRGWHLKEKKATTPAGPESEATPASAPGWMDDEYESPGGRQQANYGRPSRAYGNHQGYGESDNGRYGNGYDNGHDNGYDTGYGRDHGYNQRFNNMNYRPQPQGYNMGYSGGYKK